MIVILCHDRRLAGAAAEVLGFEVELAWYPTEHLTITGGYTFLDTEFKEFKHLSGGPGPIAAAGHCTVIPTGDPIGSSNTCEIDRSGNKLDYAPQNSFVGFLGYRRPLTAQTQWFGELDFIAQSSRKQDVFNTVSFGSYRLVNVRLGLGNDRWEALIYADNVFDDQTIKTGFRNIYTNGINVVAFPPPFTFGLPSNQTPIMPDKVQIGGRVSIKFGANL